MNAEQLKKFCDLHTSEDYKDRVKAEYMCLDGYIKGLQAMLEKWDKGELTFEPKVPKHYYESQLRYMICYKTSLIQRAEKDDIQLSDEN